MPQFNSLREAMEDSMSRLGQVPTVTEMGYRIARVATNRHKHPMRLPSPFTQKTENTYPPFHPHFLRGSPPPTEPLLLPYPSQKPTCPPLPIPPLKKPHKKTRRRIVVPRIPSSVTLLTAARLLMRLRHYQIRLVTLSTHQRLSDPSFASMRSRMIMRYPYVSLKPRRRLGSNSIGVQTLSQSASLTTRDKYGPHAMFNPC